MMPMAFSVNTYTKEVIKKTKNHLYIKPHDDLKRVVAHYTITFANVNTIIPKHSVLHLIPDVSGCIVFQFYDEMSITLWGPTTQVVTVKNDLNDAPSRFFVEFLPAGFYQVFGGKMKDLQDQKVDLKDFHPSLYEEIRIAYQHMKSFDELLDYMNMLIIREIQKHPIEVSILECIEEIYQRHEVVKGKDIAKQLYMSERQVSRYFNQYVGMGVKKYAKIANINHVINRLTEKSLCSLSYDYEYFDQAHFNHVFKEICEATPSHYIKNISDFYNELFKFST